MRGPSITDGVTVAGPRNTIALNGKYCTLEKAVKGADNPDPPIRMQLDDLDVLSYFLAESVYGGRRKEFTGFPGEPSDLRVQINREASADISFFQVLQLPVFDE